MKTRFLLAAALALSCVASYSFADADFQITELYFGLSGSDGTEDWIEITNFGTMSGDTATLFYDDISADIMAAGNLDSFILAPGESAIFLIDDNTDSIDEFNMLWSGVANVGLTNGGGGLGQDDDAAFLLNSDGDVIESVAYGSGLENILLDTEANGTQVYATVQSSLFGSTFSSSLTDGLSGEFENTNLNDTAPNLVRLAGNPGITAIPEPNMAIVLALASVGIYRRKR